MITCEQNILAFAASGNVFGSSEIMENLNRADMSRPVVNATLARMANEGKILRVGYGRYVAAPSTKIFLPEVNPENAALFKEIKQNFPYASMCLYEGRWIFPLMHHVAINNATYIEVERIAAESVFEWLRGTGKEAYFRPDDEFIYRYVDLRKTVYIVKILTSQSPLSEIDGIPVPTLEKLLVDMYCDKDFSYLQGAEYYHIMNAAQNMYPLSKKTLLRYASRRNVKEKIEKIMEESKYDID